MTPHSSDVDANALKGIAITNLAASSTGSSWYSLNNGANWTVISPTNASNALLLPSTARLQFLPSQNGVQQPTFSYRAWDQTSGTVAERVDLSLLRSRGITTAFSLAQGTARIEVR